MARPAGFATERPRITSLLLGAAASTGFEPLHLWPITLACLAGLTALLSQATNRKSALGLGYAFGVGHFIVGLNWIAHAFTYQDAMPQWLGHGAVVVLSLYLAVYPAIATGLAWVLGRRSRLALILCLAGSWAIAEYLRAFFFTGFAWNPLGVIWLGTGVAQSAAVIGTYGLGAIAVLASGGLWLLITRRWRPALAITAAPLVLAGTGWLRADQERLDLPSSAVTRVRVVQPNINQDEKYDAGREAENFRRLAALTIDPTKEPRLVFWPEAAVPAILDMEPEWRLRLASLLEPGDLLMLGGDKFHFRETARDYYQQRDLIGANNSLWVLTPDARIIGRYDKAHLVPYGEYLPMRPILSAIGLSRLVPGDIDFWPGPGPRTLDLPATDGRPPLKMGVQICYEIIFSGQVVDRTHRPDFIFNPSNDAWFGSWGPPQHLAQARLRAIEESLPVIRSTPTGISAVVDRTGNVIDRIGYQRQGAIASLLPRAGAPTPFARLGNLLPMLFAALLLMSGVAIARAKR